MGTSLRGRRFVALEVVVVIAVLLIIAFLLMALSRHSEKTPRALCIGNMRQLATSVRMYCQDNNGQYPGMDWASAIEKYVGSRGIYSCPSDVLLDEEKPISYGYSGLLVRPDGTGISEKQIINPWDACCIADAAPSKRWMSGGGLLPGGALQDTLLKSVVASPRHGGIVIGFCDGHAKYVYGEKMNPRDLSHSVARGFYQANALGLVDNPAGGLEAFSLPGTPNAAPLTIGGDSCSYPILAAAADAWQQKAPGFTWKKEFDGQYAAGGRFPNYVWGTGDGADPGQGSVPIGRDCMLVIVSKNGKIPLLMNRASVKTGFVPFATLEEIRQLFTRHDGYSANAIQAYTYDRNSGSRAYFVQHICGAQPGKQAVVVNSDLKMVDRVAGDPYGIGYCSSAAADMDRVDALTIRKDGVYHIWPNTNPKYRWFLLKDPAVAEGSSLPWPFVRTLYARCGGAARAGASDAVDFQEGMLNLGSAGRRAIIAGPLFAASYWTLPGE